MVVDRGDDLGLTQLASGGVDQLDAADDVHLPQLHRSRPFEPHIRVPRSLARARPQQAMPNQNAVDGALRRHHQHFVRPRTRPAQHLQPDPPRPPPRMLSTHLRNRNLHRLSHLSRRHVRATRTICQTSQLLSQIPSDPAMQHGPVHPNLRGNLDDIRPGKHRTNRVKTLLNHRQDNQRQSRPPQSQTPPRRRQNQTDRASHCRS